MVAALLFQELLQKSNKMLFPLGSIHEWNEGNNPGAALLGIGSRRDETTFVRCIGHTQDQWHLADLKVYPSCPNCNLTQAAPAHILASIGCHKGRITRRLISSNFSSY
ncbi:hypothetical protein TNCV_4237241 [Trichonephila clavipes]|nr:hypothetical protein TNCV_4237241 [Trichonephila clavipes]